MITMPMTGWVARLGPQQSKLASFSIGRYGPQRDSDVRWMPDAGNGIRPDGMPVTGNDPADANTPFSPADAMDWVRHMVGRWGPAAAGGVRYYLLDNEPGLWHETHRDIRPAGIRAGDYLKLSADYARAIRAADPAARIVAPEAWGWNGYRYSGYDQDYARRHGWSALPDRDTVLAGQDYLPWLLSRWKALDVPVDIVSVHYYPQGGEYGSDASPRMQMLRNRSTRSLWDPAYVDESWIKAPVALIPRLRAWVDRYYRPGTPIALTEYSWGADAAIGGATAQADLLGIFGREGLDMANRWIMPAPDTPTYKAIRLYRNYDGRGGAFGDVSVAATTPDPDRLAAFAAERGSDGAMTVMLVNKTPGAAAIASLDIRHFRPAGLAERYQLTAENRIDRLADIACDDGRAELTLPAQSITLLVVKGARQHD